MPIEQFGALKGYLTDEVGPSPEDMMHDFNTFRQQLVNRMDALHLGFDLNNIRVNINRLGVRQMIICDEQTYYVIVTQAANGQHRELRVSMYDHPECHGQFVNYLVPNHQQGWSVAKAVDPILLVGGFNRAQDFQAINSFRLTRRTGDYVLVASSQINESCREISGHDPLVYPEMATETDIHEENLQMAVNRLRRLVDEIRLRVLPVEWESFGNQLEHSLNAIVGRVDELAQRLNLPDARLIVPTIRNLAWIILGYTAHFNYNPNLDQPGNPSPPPPPPSDSSDLSDLSDESNSGIWDEELGKFNRSRSSRFFD